MTQEEAKVQIVRLYKNYKSEKMADRRDWVAYDATRIALRDAENQYFLNHGERFNPEGWEIYHPTEEDEQPDNELVRDDGQFGMGA